MNLNADVRNFKDFLQIYNNLSETCFNGCVDVLNSRSLENHEVKCVAECAEKFIKLNHRFMAMYIENQQIIVNKRIKEAEELASTVATAQDGEDISLTNSDLLVEATNQVST